VTGLLQSARPGGQGPARLARWERRLLPALLAGLLAAHIGRSVQRGYSIAGHDALHYYAHLRSPVFDGDFDYHNELVELPRGPRAVTIVPQTGRPANKYPAGWALVSMVPYLIAHGLASLARWVSGSPHAATGYELYYQLAATCPHVVAAWGGLALSYRLSRRFLPARACAPAAAVVLLGSPLLYYSVNALDFAHAAGFFCVALFVVECFALARPEGARWDHWALLGVAGGLMVVVRYSNAVFALVLLHPAAGLLRRRQTRRLAGGCAVALLAALPILAWQMWVWKQVFGSWIVYSYGEEGFDWLSPALGSYLFSPRKELLFWSPALAAGLLGLGLGIVWRDGPVPRGGLAATAAAAGALIYVNASWWCWWFSWSFGSRAYVEASPVLLLGTACAFARARGRPARAGLALLCGLGVLWINFLLLLHATNHLRPDGPEDIGQLLDAIRSLLS